MRPPRSTATGTTKNKPKASDSLSRTERPFAMNKRNYDKEMLVTMQENAGKRLLLHSCCAPCSSYCLTQVAPVFRTTVFYFNPNLDSEEEYLRRKGEQIRLLKETGAADLLDCDYEPEAFREIAEGYEDEPEGGARCKRCYLLRLTRTAEEAKKGGYDFFGTTLTVSPLKDSEALNAIGFALAEKYGVRYLPSDFKKRNGYLRSIELSKTYGLYRQNYCGCIYSRRDLSPAPCAPSE